MSLLLLTGAVGSGKSTLASSIIKHLGAHPSRCQYYFFASTHDDARQVSTALRHIAFQLASVDDAFCERLLRLFENKIMSPDRTDARVIWSKVFETIIFKTQFHYPLTWVFDGWDAAKEPGWLFEKLRGACPSFPLRVLITTRPEASPHGLLSSASARILRIQLEKEDTKEDMRLLARAKMQTIPLDARLSQDLTERVVARSSGSFIWLCLTLETLCGSWCTQGGHQKALDMASEGMDTLYEHMLVRITNLEKTEPRRFTLASIILAWGTCAARPITAVDLETVLQSHSYKTHNIEYTIRNVCGSFVIVKNDLVLPCHETARAFLFDPGGHEGRRFVRAECHRQLALDCLGCLNSSSFQKALRDIGDERQDLRTSVEERAKSAPFIWYATVYWSYHVRQADQASEEFERLLQMTQSFLQKSVLFWIHACALLGQVSVITSCAYDLQETVMALRSQASWRQSRFRETLAYLESWAIDLIRMAGRFGDALNMKPSSIYRVLPAFFPESTMLFRSYAAKCKLAVVRGGPYQAWDDCVARLQISTRMPLSRIVAARRSIFCLDVCKGEVVELHAETGQVTRKIQHGRGEVNEEANMLSANRSGTLLITGGPTCYEVWDLISGEKRCRRNYSRGELATEISFGSTDSNVIICRLDRRIECQQWATGNTVWQRVLPGKWIHTQLAKVAVNPEGTRAAEATLGYSVLIWDLEDRDNIRPLVCSYDGKCDKSPARYLAWHPGGKSVIVLYRNGAIVCFDLADATTRAVFNTGAATMAVSPDGRLLVTADSAGGLSLWSMKRLRRVYALPPGSHVDAVTFSADSKRIYDLRQSVCNIWEPSILIKHRSIELDLVDHGSHEPIDYVEYSVPHVPITTLAHGPFDRYFLCGRKDGRITLRTTTDGKEKMSIMVHGRSWPTKTTWSASRKHVAVSFDDGRLMVKKVTPTEGPEAGLVVTTCIDVLGNTDITGFAFNGAGTLLLVSSASGDSIWNLKTGTEVWRREGDAGCGTRATWLNLSWDGGDEFLLHTRVLGTAVYRWPELDAVDGSRPPKVATRLPPPTGGASLSGWSVKTVAVAPIGEGVKGVTMVVELRDRHTGLHGDEEDRMRLEVLRLHPDTLGMAVEAVRMVTATEMRTTVPQSTASTRTPLATGGSVSPDATVLPVLLRRKPLAAAASDFASDSVFRPPISVRLLLGIYRSRVVFVDAASWVCTLPLPVDSDSESRASGTDSQLTRHFPIPRECIAYGIAPAVEMVTLLRDGTVLLPMANGEVMIVRNGLDEPPLLGY